MPNQLPLIPFIQNPHDIIFALLVMARVTGVFLLAPVLSHASLKAPVRAIIIILVTALLSMTLYPDYRGPDARFHVSVLDPEGPTGILLLALLLFKELAVGFIIGFCFALVMESLVIAGQLTGVVIGFSIAQMLDPVSGRSQSMLANLFIISATLIVISLDLHHLFFQACARSFSFVPIGHYSYPPELLDDITRGTARAFTYSINYAAVPFAILFLITIGLGFMAKVMPEMNIFMVGFPLRIFIGYYALIFAIAHFPNILQHAFIEYSNLIERIMIHIGPDN